MLIQPTTIYIVPKTITSIEDEYLYTIVGIYSGKDKQWIAELCNHLTKIPAEFHNTGLFKWVTIAISITTIIVVKEWILLAQGKVS